MSIMRQLYKEKVKTDHPAKAQSFHDKQDKHELIQLFRRLHERFTDLGLRYTLIKAALIPTLEFGYESGFDEIAGKIDNT